VTGHRASVNRAVLDRLRLLHGLPRARRERATVREDRQMTAPRGPQGTSDVRPADSTVADERRRFEVATPAQPSTTETRGATIDATVDCVTTVPMVGTDTNSSHDVPRTLKATVANTLLGIVASRLLHRFLELVMRWASRTARLVRDNR